MNTEEPRIDSKKIALNSLKSAFRVFLKDLEALPEDAYLNHFGGSARTIADIVYEVNLVNDHIGMVIRGEEPFQWPDNGWIKAPEGFDNKATVKQAFEESSNKMIATIEGFTRDEMEEPIQTEDGETNRFERCRFMALHVWYHAGQLNYVQTLLGDEVWHWQEA